jgi:hypothetical protein
VTAGPKAVAEALSSFGPIVSVALALGKSLTKHSGVAFVTFLNAEDATVCADVNDAHVGGRRVPVELVDSESFEFQSFSNFQAPRAFRLLVIVGLLVTNQLFGAVPLGLTVASRLLSGMLESALEPTSIPPVVVVVFSELVFGVTLHFANKLLAIFARRIMLPRVRLVSNVSATIFEFTLLMTLRITSIVTISASTVFQCLGVSDCTPDPLGSRLWFEAAARSTTAAIVGELLGNVVFAPLWRLVRQRVFRCRVSAATIDVADRAASVLTMAVFALFLGASMPFLFVVAFVCMAVQCTFDSLRHHTVAKDAALSARGLELVIIRTAIDNLSVFMTFAVICSMRAFDSWLNPLGPAFAGLEEPLLITGIAIVVFGYVTRLLSATIVRRAAVPLQPFTAFGVIDSFAFPGALHKDAVNEVKRNGVDGTVRFDRHHSLSLLGCGRRRRRMSEDDHDGFEGVAKFMTLATEELVYLSHCVRELLSLSHEERVRLFHRSVLEAPDCSSSSSSSSGSNGTVRLSAGMLRALLRVAWRDHARALLVDSGVVPEERVADVLACDSAEQVAFAHANFSNMCLALWMLSVTQFAGQQAPPLPLEPMLDEFLLWTVSLRSRTDAAASQQESAASFVFNMASLYFLYQCALHSGDVKLQAIALKAFFPIWFLVPAPAPDVPAPSESFDALAAKALHTFLSLQAEFTSASLAQCELPRDAMALADGALEIAREFKALPEVD